MPTMCSLMSVDSSTADDDDTSSVITADLGEEVTCSGERQGALSSETEEEISFPKTWDASNRNNLRVSVSQLSR